MIPVTVDPIVLSRNVLLVLIPSVDLATKRDVIALVVVDVIIKRVSVLVMLVTMEQHATK